MPFELCTPKRGGTGSFPAAADPMGAVGGASVGREDLSLEDEGSRSRRGSRVVVTGGLAGATKHPGG